MEDLENKIQGELKTLKDQLETIQTNSIKFTGVDDLRYVYFILYLIIVSRPNYCISQTRN